jgi:hypothetical protein
MRVAAAASCAGILLATFLGGVEPKECLDLSARQEHDVSSPSGIRVIVAGRNHCSEDLDGDRCRFRVKILGSGNAVIATQSGTFGGTIASHGSAESLVFVVCDPERVRSVAVEAEES